MNQSRETEPRMRDPQKVLDQDEDSDLVQRRASNIQEYLLIDPTVKVDTNVVDQVEIIVNNDVVNNLNSNNDIVDNLVTSPDMNVVGELLHVSRLTNGDRRQRLGSRRRRRPRLRRRRWRG